MSETKHRGDLVLAPDPFNDSGRRPAVIVSNEEYPFHPHGYLGIPVTSKDKQNTYQIHEYDMVEVHEELYIQPSYVNPWSPHQINTTGRTLLTLSESFIDTLVEDVAAAVGVRL